MKRVAKERFNKEIIEKITMDLNKRCDEVHANAVVKGFWDNPLSDSHCLMLVIRELSEAIEADNIDKRADKFGFDTAIANTHNGEVRDEWLAYAFNRCIKNFVEDELADALILLLDLFGAREVYEGDILLI